jgi:hypothetical protein
MTDTDTMRSTTPTVDLTTEAAAVVGLEGHKGRGILPGDFVKPDPAMTRQETRRYILEELHRWLVESPLVDHAMEIVEAGVEPAELAPLVAAGRWPAARLALVVMALECMPRTIVGLPVDRRDRFVAVAEWCVDVCEDHLRGYAAIVPAARMAVGFVTEDRLPEGSTIAPFWNWSPFEALRNAPPLPDDDPPEKAEAEDDKPFVWTIQANTTQILIVLGGVTAYLWAVAMLLGSRKQ